MKRLLTFLALCISITLPSLAYDFEVDGIYYTKLSVNTAEVTYKDTKYNSYRGNVSIPVSVKYNSSTYRVTSIGNNAFYNCTGLTSITIPNLVSSIGNNAFYNCTGLTSFYGKFASSDNRCLIVNGNLVAFAPSGLSQYSIPTSVKSIGNNVFYNCTGLTSIDIPTSVTSIGTGAFKNCTGLTSIDIPNSVTTIDSSTFYGCTGLTSISLPNYVTSINDYAFYYCSSLTSVYIGNNVTSIGKYAFCNCSGLTSITIPNSVTAIGQNAFVNCTGLKSVTIPNSVNSIGWALFYGCTGLTSITIPSSVTSISSSAFCDCTNLKKVINYSSLPLQKGSKDYGYVAYYAGALYNAQTDNQVNGFVFSVIDGEPSLEMYIREDVSNLTLPNNHNGNSYKIGDYAFYDCTGLTSVTIPKSITSIGSEAFHYCTNLKTVTNYSSLPLQKGSTNYGYVAYYADVLYNIIDNFKFKEVDGVATLVGYNGNVTSNLILPQDYNGVSYKIGSNAFKNCTGLTSITIPESVTSIDTHAFYGCTGLTSFNGKFASSDNRCLIVNGSLNAFAPAGISDYTIPNSVTSISQSAFVNCTGLKSITIPNSVTSIGNEAFLNCTNLKKVTNFSSLTLQKGSTDYGYVAYYADIVNNISQTDNIIDNFIFENVNGVATLKGYIGEDTPNLILPQNYNGASYKIGDNAFANCNGLTSITIPNTVTSIGSEAFAHCSGLTSITIPESVTSIGNAAFSFCTGLTSITIPNSITAINIQTFYYCTSLTSINLPNSLTSIGNNAFYGCSGLSSISIPESVTSIGELAFNNCTGLTSVTIPSSITSIDPGTFGICTGLTSITIPNSVSTIGSSAFYDCTGLTSITIPNSVTSINSNAFYNCSKLKTVINQSSLPLQKGSTDYGYVAYYADAAYNLSQNEHIIDNFIFEEINGVAILKSYIGKLSPILILPNDYNGASYKIGNNAFNGCSGLTSVTIPNSVISIGKSAFHECTGLKSVTIGNSVTTIDSFAFADCPGLTSITIPESVTSIGESAFLCCSGLSSFNGKYASSDNRCLIVDGKLIAFAPSGLSEYSIPNSVTKIDNTVFFRCYDLTSITIPESVTSIGNGAFEVCNALTSVTIPASVTSIGNYAFSDCTALTTVNFNATKCTSMGTSSQPVFDCCNNLTTVSIAENVTAIPSYAFRGCAGLSSITIPASVTSIGSEAFYNCSNLKTVTNYSSLPLQKGSEDYGHAAYYADVVDNYKDNFIFENVNGVATLKGYIGEVPPNLILPQDYNGASYKIGDNAFKNCTGLTSITIPNSVTSIGNSAFYGCTGLSSITIPNSVTSIGSQAFRGCTGLSSITIPNSVTSIGSSLFYGCTGLTSITVPNSVTSIGNQAFRGCAGLTSITIPNSITSIGTEAFLNCNNLKTITNYSTLPLQKGSSDFGYVAYYADAVYNLSQNEIILDNFLFEETDGIATLKAYIGELTPDLILPQNYKGTSYKIGDNAFKNCSGLTSITISESVTSIGNSALYGCNGLTSITIPASVTSIGKWAFYGCSGLTSISIPASVNSIGESAFNSCTDLSSVTIPNSITSIEPGTFRGCTGLTSITIPNAVTSIGSSSFYGCSGLTSITIPNSVTSIGSEAFRYCSNLKKVTNFSSLPIQKGSSSYGYVAYYADEIYTISQNSNIIDNFVFEDIDGVATLKAYIGEASPNLVLPNDYNGNSYAIGDNAFTSNQMYSLIIPNKVTKIGREAFKNCKNLISVKIGAGVLEMGQNAFSGCSNLYKVFLMGNTKPTGIESAFTSLSGRLTYVSNSKYNDIASLGTIKIYSSLNSMFEVDGVRYIPISMSSRTCDVVDCTYDLDVTTVIIDETTIYRGIVMKVQGVGNHIFRNNPYITNAMLNMSTDVPDYALDNVRALKSLTIGANITGFGVSAFGGTVELSNLTFGDGETPLTINDNSIWSICPIAELYIGRDISYTKGNSESTYSPFSGKSTLRSLKFGKSVTTVAPYMFYHTPVEVLVFGSSIKSIGEYAFYYCSSLQKIAFPSGITTIGVAAFKNTNPTSLRFPASLASIGAQAFDGCANIESIRFDDASQAVNVACSFSGSGAQTAYLGRNFAENQTPFAGCSTLRTAQLSEFITQLYPSFFKDCQSLQVVNLPSKITSVPAEAFSGCTALSGIELPAAVTSIGNKAFYHAGIPSIEIGRQVTSVGTQAFAGCERMQYASVAATNIGEEAFCASALKQVDISKDVTTVGTAVFKNCANLTNANIGAASIGNQAFMGCTSLTVAALDNRTLAIGSQAFEGCSSLSTVNIPEGNTRIASSAFKGTTSLTEITLPQSLTSIDANAFYGSGLLSATIPGAVNSIADYAFAETRKLSVLTLGESSNAIIMPISAFKDSPIEAVYINRQLNYEISSGSPFASSGTLRTVVMNDVPTSILQGMFRDCTKLESVKISENLNEIGSDAFNGCSALTTVNIPTGVKEIASATFKGCSSLTSIDLPAVTKLREESFANSGLQSFVAQPCLEQIALGSFKDCRALAEFVALSGSKQLELSNSAPSKGMFADCPITKVSIDRPISYSILPEYGYSPFYRSTTLKTVELGDYVPSVPDNMFYGCTNLTDVVIGDGVTSFGKYAFSGCQSIERFYFGGNVESIGEEAFSDCTAMVEMWSQSVVPPTCSSQALADIDKWTCELFVPMGAVDAYSEADQWQDFLIGESTGKRILATGISLSKLALNMKIDDKADVMATILPTSVQSEFPVTWTTTNAAVATVTNGKIQAVGAGECQIVAKITANGTITSACNVKVDKLDQELLWVQAFGGVYIGDKVTFTGKADSGDDITYTIVGGDNIGEIAGNVLTINDIGTMEIEAVQAGGNRYNESNVVKRSITVIPVNPKEITVDSDITVHEGQQLAINAQIQPLNAYDKSIVWTSLDEEIASVDSDGKITGVYNGETYVVATASNGLSARCRVRVNAPGDDYLSVDDAVVDATDTWQMPVNLTNLNEIASAEFDVELPQTIQFETDETDFVEIQLTQRAQDYTVMANLLDEQTLHVEIFSFGDDIFSGNSGDAILTIPVQANNSPVPVIVKLTNVKLYTRGGEAIMPGDDNASITISGASLPGDVDGDGKIDVNDLGSLVNIVCGLGSETPGADVDGDGKVDVNDLGVLINLIVGL